MLVGSRRAAAFAVGTALLALATACTNPTAPSATPRATVHGTLGDGGVIVGGGTHQTPSGVIVGGGT